MPVSLDRLLPLLLLMFLSYSVLKVIITSLMIGDSMATSKIFKREQLDRNTFKYVSKITYRTFLESLLTDSDVRSEFFTVLKTSEFFAYFFETPKISEERLDEKKFEFILARASSLEGVSSDVDAFDDYFNACDKSVTSFKNLGGDAMLITPCPLKDVDLDIFSTLAPFMKAASSQHIQQFWETAASSALDLIKNRGRQPTWMSTSGLGVYWLHLRLDSTPKYYTYSPYKI